MCSVALDLVVEGMVDCDGVVAVVIEGVGQQLEAWPMACSVVSARVVPGGGDEEIGVYSLVQQGVDGVVARAVLQQRRAQLEADAGRGPVRGVPRQLADSGALRWALLAGV